MAELLSFFKVIIPASYPKVLLLEGIRLGALKLAVAFVTGSMYVTELLKKLFVARKVVPVAVSALCVIPLICK